MKFFTLKLRSSADFYTQIALMLVVVILVQIIFSLLPIRFDITEARVYSVSAVTRKTLKDLDDVVTLKAYFTEDLPGYLITVREQVHDMLKEYQTYGGGKIQVKMLNPNSAPEVAREAETVGIPPIQLNVVRKDKVELAQGYLGIAVLYEDKSEAIPVVQDISTLEYDLTSAIKKVTSGKSFAIGLAQKEGTFIDEDELEGLRQVLQRQYSVVNVDIGSGKIIDDYVTTLIVPGPKTALTERELYMIDQFAMSGRGVLFLVDGVLVEKGMTTNKNESNIIALLYSYGVTINKDLVYDSRYSGEASFVQGVFTFFTPYGFWPKISKSGFNQESVLTNKLETVMFPWVSTIQADESQDKVILVRASKDAGRVLDIANIAPDAPPATSGNGEFPVVVRVQGSLKSHFKGAVAKDVKEEDDAQSNTEGEEKFISETTNARVVVVSDADFVKSGFLQREESNIVFLQNLVDGLTLDESLAAIRSKAVTERPIKQLDDTARVLVKYGNIIGIPLIVVLFAVGHFIIRRKSQRVGEM